jgi:hypothetical protein
MCNGGTNTEASPNTSEITLNSDFIFFPKLPNELRLKIWKYTVITRSINLAPKPIDGKPPADLPPARLQDVTANDRINGVHSSMYQDGQLHFSGSNSLMCSLDIDKLRAAQHAFPAVLLVCKESRNTVLNQFTSYKQPLLHNIYALQENVKNKSRDMKMFARPMCVNMGKDICFVEFEFGTDGFATANFELLNLRRPDVLSSVQTLEIRNINWDDDTADQLFQDGGPLKFCMNLEKLMIVASFDAGGWQTDHVREILCRHAFAGYFRDLEEKNPAHRIPGIILVDFAT